MTRGGARSGSAAGTPPRRIIANVADRTGSDTQPQCAGTPIEGSPALHTGSTMTSRTLPATDRLAADEWMQITPGERFTIRTSCQETNGAYFAFEVVAESGNGVPVHIHDNEEEHFIALEGTVHIANGDTTVDLTAGSAVTVKRGIPHAWCNLTDRPVRMVVVFTPGRIEGLFRTVADGTDLDLQTLAATYGTKFVGP